MVRTAENPYLRKTENNCNVAIMSTLIKWNFYLK